MSGHMTAGGVCRILQGGIPVPSLSFSTWTLGNDVHVHVAPTDKFKTVQMRIALQTPLQRETVTANALIPFVLRRGSKRLPTMRAISRHLEGLYGAAFGVDIRKMGESQILGAQFHVSSERFLPDAAGLFAESVEFLHDILLDPVTEGNAFKSDYVKTEKETLRRRIEGLIDERFQYAIQRCYANMCADEPFGIYHFGQTEDLEDITAAGLYARYRELLQRSPIHILVVGAVEPEKVRDLFAGKFSFAREGVEPVPPPASVEASETRTVIERMAVQQGILVLGCRLPVTYSDEAYPALLMYNGVLGGFSHSKLFMEVRERASLAYTAFSRMETIKGVQILFAGIDIGKFEQARDIMLSQIEAIRRGEVSDAELEATRKALVNGLMSSLDDAGQIIHNRLFGAVAGRMRDVTEVVEAVKKVTLDEIVQVAQGVKLDTIYFLRDQEAKGE